jgi:hypothetical protein
MGHATTGLLLGIVGFIFLSSKRLSRGAARLTPCHVEVIIRRTEMSERFYAISMRCREILGGEIEVYHQV